METVRVAHLGIAHDHSMYIMETMRKYPQIFQIVGVCEPDPRDRAQFGGNPVYEGLPWLTQEELFARDDIDCAVVEGYELRSLAAAEKCIERGWHVHMDKPGGCDCARFEKVLSLAKQKGLAFEMGYMYRYNPALKYVLEKKRNGELGEVLHIDGSFGVRHSDEKRAWLNAFPGGMMFFLGCHLIDMVYAIAGVPDRIIPLNKKSMVNGVEATDNAFAVFEYANGVAAIHSNAAEVNGFSMRRLLVSGSKASIEICPLENPTHMYEATLAGSDGLEWKDAKHEVFPGFLAGRYDEMMLRFAACVRGEMMNPYAYKYEARLQRLILAACGEDVDFAGPIDL